MLGWYYHAQNVAGHLTNIKQSRVKSDAAQLLVSWLGRLLFVTYSV